jgi:hypothetical protein
MFGMKGTNETIVWDVDAEGKKTGTGTMTIFWKTSNMTGPCYNKKVGVENETAGFVNLMINIPQWNTDENKDKLVFGRYSTLRSIRPTLSPSEITTIKDVIKDVSRTIIYDHVKNMKLDNSKLTDFEFLALLGTKRNWKKGCAICLTDDIMGTTCTCGHTEIVVFRPCGHSICIDPCFKTFVKQHNIILKQETVTYGDQTFNVAGKVATNIDFDCNNRFECPECRTSIARTFRAEDVKSLKNSLLMDKIKDQIIQKLNNKMIMTDQN